MFETSPGVRLQALVLIGFLISPGGLDAQTVDSTGTPRYRLQEIEVTASRSARPYLQIPYTVDIIGTDGMRSREIGLSLEETLRSVAGVFVSNRHNLAQGDRISMRGLGSRAPFGVRGVKVILDGIPLSFPDGQSQLNNLDISSTAIMEVLPGPHSALYGNATGGLIQITSEQNSDAIINVASRALLGSYGLKKGQIQISGSTGKHGYFANITQLVQEGFREHSGGKSTNFNLRSRYNLSNRIKLTALVNYVNAPYLLNPSSLAKDDAGVNGSTTRFFVKQQGAGKQIEQGQAGLNLHLEVSEHSRFEVIGYGVRRYLFNPIPGRIVDLDRISGGIRMTYDHSLRTAGGSHRLTIGADFEIQDDTRQEFQNLGLADHLVGRFNDERVFENIAFGVKLLDQDETVLGGGGFLMLDLMLSQRLALVLAGRYDVYRFQAADRFFEDGKDNFGRRTMARFSPSMGINFTPEPTVAFYGNLTSGFQTPTTTELGNRPDGLGGFNPDLHPEKMRSVEFGLKKMSARWNVRAAVYHMTITDMLVPFQIEEDIGEEVFFRNAGKSRNMGFELSLEGRPHHNITLTLSYTLMNFKFEDFEVERSVERQTELFQLSGNEVPGVPRNQVFAGVVLEYPAGIFFETKVRWVDRYFTNDFNGAVPGGLDPTQDFVNDEYWLLDMRAGLNRTFGRIYASSFFGLSNVLNGRYNGSVVPNAVENRFFEPAPGRTFYVGVAISIPN